jgi:hypothetical protein
MPRAHNTSVKFRISIRITGVQGSTRKVTIAPGDQGMETYMM